MAALDRGEGVLAAAHAGLSAAHTAAAVVAGIAVVVGVIAFPRVREPLVPRAIDLKRREPAASFDTSRQAH